MNVWEQRANIFEPNVASYISDASQYSKNYRQKIIEIRVRLLAHKSMFKKNIAVDNFLNSYY